MSFPICTLLEAHALGTAKMGWVERDPKLSNMTVRGGSRQSHLLEKGRSLVLKMVSFMLKGANFDGQRPMLSLNH